MNATKYTSKKEKKATPPKGVWHGSKLSPAVIGSLFGRLEDVATRLDDFLVELEGYLPTDVPAVEEDGSDTEGEEVVKLEYEWNPREGFVLIKH